MIEKQFIKQSKREYMINDYLKDVFLKAGFSSAKIIRTPLGEKIQVFLSKPYMALSRRSSSINLRQITQELKQRFNFENPVIEVIDVPNPDLDARVVASRLAYALERNGIGGFKGLMHKAMTNIMKSGAKGVEIIFSGRLPSQRAKSWRVFAGHLKKCGEYSVKGVSKAIVVAKLKIGAVGIKVRIALPNVDFPDVVKLTKESEEKTEQTNKHIIEDKKLVQLKRRKSYSRNRRRHNSSNPRNNPRSRSNQRSNSRSKNTKKNKN